MIVTVVILFVLELITGQVSIPLSSIVNWIGGERLPVDAWEVIIRESRMPRALAATFAGGSLAISGLLMQTLFRNPLAGPDVLGVTSGASLGVALLIMTSGAYFATTSFQWSFVTIAMAAFIGAFAVLALIIAIAERLPDNLTLIILGLMFSYFTGAIVGAIQFKASGESLRAFVFWGMGSFAEAGFSEIMMMAVALFIAMVAVIFLLPRLNILLLGEDYATSMGVNVKRTRLYIILATGVLTSCVTAFCGPIAFIGLAVPHLARMVMRSSNHYRLLFPILLLGMIMALFCDLVSRWLELPLNTIASALGAPIVILIVLRGARTKAII